MREIICGGAKHTPQNADNALYLDVHGIKQNIDLKIQDTSKALLSNIPPVLLDLLEVAAYVYCADQRTHRGSQTLSGMGERWHKIMRFVIPVRQPAIWNSTEVQDALKDCLGFLSDHSYEFEFVQGKNNLNSSQDYLDLNSDTNTAGFTSDEVALFSGGLDSFSGAVEDLVANKKRLVLVGHHSSDKVFNIQKNLLAQLRTRELGKQIFYVPVKIRKINTESGSTEYTQRTRSFIFASLAITIAQLFKKDKIKFYENGVITLNPPLGQDILGARATRTTHPKVLRGFERIFSLLLNKPIMVEHPFQWMTKKEVIALLEKNKYADLIGITNSCTRPHRSSTEKTHCGVCSQCIDRRFGVLAAGLGAHDPQSQYACDLMLGNRGERDDVVMAVNYVKFAQDIADMSLNQMIKSYPQIIDALEHYQDGDVINRVFDMLQRHAQDVKSVVSASVKENGDNLSAGLVPEKSILSMVATGAKIIPLTPEGKDTAHELKNFMDGMSTQPCEFALDEKKNIVVFSGGLTLSASEYTLIKALVPNFRKAKDDGSAPEVMTAQQLAKEAFNGNEPSFRQAVTRINKKVSETLGIAMGVVIDDGFIKNLHGKGYKINKTARLLTSPGDLKQSDKEAVTN